MRNWLSIASLSSCWFQAVIIGVSIHQTDAFVSAVPRATLYQPIAALPLTAVRTTSPIVADDGSSTSKFDTSMGKEAVSPKEVSPISIDPLLINALQTQTSSRFGTGVGIHLSSASNGIRTWRACLSKGRFPLDSDFDRGVVWPTEPFFSKVVDAMTTLELSRFVVRHPGTITAVLLTLIRLAFNFMGDVRNKMDEMEGGDEDFYDGGSRPNQNLEEDESWLVFDEPLQDSVQDDVSLSPEIMDAIATEVADSFIQEWNDVVLGVNMLDQLFGYDHDLLDINSQVDENGNGGATAGFGLEDGIWKHTGWREIPTLQNQINSMPELKELMTTIGRRPTAENSDEINKFSPRNLQNDGAMGAQFDPQMRESVSGITQSGSLTEMLPSEAVLLRGSSGALRRLFMAKKAESKLLSYEMSGWADVPSIPATKPLYQKRMPSAPGGPIIVCLDTSWSMSGMREQLSKAVVLACVTMAHKQRRDCQVVAFSTEKGVIEAGIITPDGTGIKRLLAFLSHSFGGGTDVTGALKFAMENLDSDVMSAADILMISDGEIPDPPVSDKIMIALDNLKLKKGVEVHGLLVGKKESKALSRLSTKIHDFLVEYDSQALFGDAVHGKSTSTTLQFAPSRCKIRSSYGFNRPILFQNMFLTSTCLKARHSGYDERGSKVRNGKKRGRKNKWNDDFDDKSNSQSQWDIEEDYDDSDEDDGVNFETDRFGSDVEERTNMIKTTAVTSIAAEAWTPKALLVERNATGSCWKYKKDLEDAVERVGEGLIERQTEACLVVLAMLSMEHILLLGVPGTGKSVLGRRLSKLCDGDFFQRLLTKFSTPEELFGPLSLKSLENDEYRRCTEGYLPTSEIAFLDEIFKANSAILNTLLTILNERKFDNAGGQEECPVRCVVGASNELPESDELIALFDRFLIRKEVLPVSDEGVINLLSMTDPGCTLDVEEGCAIPDSENLDAIITNLSIAADSIIMDIEICELIRDLRNFMREELNVEISDRRLVKTGRLLKISAASHGRTKVDPLDCLLLQHCMWQIPEQQAVIRDWLWDNLTPGGQINQFRFLLDTLRGEVSDVIRRTSGDIAGDTGGREADISMIKSLRKEIYQLTSTLQKHQSDLARHIELLRRADEYLWIDPEEMQSVQQLLQPRAEKVLIEVEEALSDSRSLELCLEGPSDTPVNKLRLSIIQGLWEEGYKPEITFRAEELNMGMKEAKKKYDLETFRKWKRAKKKLKS